MTTELETVAIDANGLTFTARAAGPPDGRPVLLLHGFPQTSLCFAHEVAALGAAGYRAVAPDQRGYSAGARPAEVGAYTADHLVSDVASIADALGMGAFDLVGHDWGGMVAWLTAAAHPRRVRTLTSALHWYRANHLEAPGPVVTIGMPTLYVWSTGDAALGREAAEATAGCVDGPYRFEVLEGISHWVPDEAPAQLHDLLTEHLAAHP